MPGGADRVAPPLVEQVAAGGKAGLKYNLHPGQLRAWQSDKRIVAVIAGVRSGKSSFGPLWLHREMARKGPGDYLVVAPTFPLLDKAARPELENLLGRLLRLGESVRGEFRVSEEGHRRLWPGVEPGRPSRVIFAHAGNPESLAAMTVKAAWLDEAGQRQFRLASFEEVQRRVSFDRGRVLITSTVYDLGWLKQQLHDPWEAAGRAHPEIDIVNFDSTANPAYPREEWERASRTLPLWKFNMFHRGMFERPAGLIYDRFDPRRHSRPRFRVPPEWPRYCGLDFGTVNAAAVMLAAELGADRLPTGRFYAYREYHPGLKIDPQTHAHNLLEGEPGTPVFVGGARSENDWRLRFRAAGVPVQEPPVFDVEVQIDSLHALIANDRLLVMDDLTGLLDELASYSRVVDDRGEPTAEIDSDQLYHYLAALRYLAAYLARDTMAGWKPTRSHQDQSMTAGLPADVFGPVERRDKADGPERAGRVTAGEGPGWLAERFPVF